MVAFIKGRRTAAVSLTAVTTINARRGCRW